MNDSCYNSDNEKFCINQIQVEYKFQLSNNKTLSFDGIEYEEIIIQNNRPCLILIVPELPMQIENYILKHEIVSVVRTPYSYVDWSFTDKIYAPNIKISNPKFHLERLSDKIKIIIIGGEI